MDVRAVVERDLAAVAKIALANDEHDGADPRYVRHQAEHGRFLVAADDLGVAGYGSVRQLGGATMLCDLFVDPVRHGGGIGRRLLDALFDGAGDRFTFASKDPRAMSLYARFGMVPQWPLLYLAGPPRIAAAATALTCERVPPEQAAETDCRLTGAERTADFRFWADTSGGGPVIVRAASGIVAAGAVTADRIHHLVTAEGHDPVAALAAVLGTLTGSTVRLCLPGPHPAVAPLLDGGWRIEDNDHHMTSRPGLVSASLVPSPALG